jgi:hypothetical protein
MQPIVIGPEGGANRASKPIERYVGEQVVAVDYRLEIACMVGPNMELLRDPGGKASR